MVMRMIRGMMMRRMIRGMMVRMVVLILKKIFFCARQKAPVPSHGRGSITDDHDEHCGGDDDYAEDDDGYDRDSKQDFLSCFSHRWRRENDGFEID